MAVMGNQNDRFAPGQAQEVSVFGKAGYQLGKVMPAPLIPNVLGNTPAAITRPQQMAQGVPRGVSEIPVIGMRPQNGGLRMAGYPAQQQQQVPALGHRPAPAPQRLLAPAPAPAPAPALQHSLGANEEARTIEVRGIAPDGREYTATYDAVFPRGTRLLGANEVQK